MHPTSTTNIFSSKSAPNTQTPSRHLAHDSQVPPLPPPHSPPPPSHPSADLTSSQASPTQGPFHPKQDVSPGRPSKRQRRTRSAANMAAERASSSSDSSSQSGMADNETEAERMHHQSDERTPPQAAAPPKKKRTRTLTTPHQSAVLHALLAKSRFPTTAMREDVGRQIGLSARKVQIWFQNQRQKARRPQSESAPLTRPPQFGPFPIMTAGPSASPYPSPSAGGPGSEKSHSGPNSARSAARESGGSLDSNPALAGPGIPGQPSSSHPLHGPSSAEEWEPPRGVPTSPSIALAHSQHLPPRPPESISKRDFLGNARGPIVQSPGQATPIETSPHFSRVLPPIQLGALRPRSSTESCVSATPPFPPPPNAPRTSVTIIQRLDVIPTTRSAIDQPCSQGPLGLPPPFALQPQPQWDPQTFAPYTRPEFASWSQTLTGSARSSARTSFSAVGAPERVMGYVSFDGTRRGYMPSGGGGRHSGQPDHDHHMHNIISPSRGHRHSMTCRTADEAGEA